MTEPPWKVAVADARNDRPLNLVVAAFEEVTVLWGELDDAIRHTIRTVRTPAGAWSIQALGIAVRIIHLSRFTGAVPWTQVPMNLVLDGTWSGLYEAAGVPHTGPTPEEMTELAELDKTHRGRFQ